MATPESAAPPPDVVKRTWTIMDSTNDRIDAFAFQHDIEPVIAANILLVIGYTAAVQILEEGGVFTEGPDGKISEFLNKDNLEQTLRRFAIELNPFSDE